MEFVATTQAPAAIGPYSQAVKVNGLVYTSGQIALRPDGTMVEDDVVLFLHFAGPITDCNAKIQFGRT